MRKVIFKLWGPFQRECQHSWHRLSFGKRYCSKCNREQWLFTKPYPAIGEPATDWKDMGFITPAGRASLSGAQDEQG